MFREQVSHTFIMIYCFAPLQRTHTLMLIWLHNMIVNRCVKHMNVESNRKDMGANDVVLSPEAKFHLAVPPSLHS